MRILLAALGLWLAMSQPQASDRWVFETRTAVTGEPTSGVYHHLDGAGRKHIALSGQTVAAVWEDNRSQNPQVYTATKTGDEKHFSAAMQVSNGSEAYEPSIASLPANRFLLAWEQDAEIHARLLTPNGLAPMRKLSSASASHVSLASFGTRVFAAWREQQDRRWFIRVASLGTSESGELAVESVATVEPAGLTTQVLFPSLAVNAAGLCVACKIAVPATRDCWQATRATRPEALARHST